MARPNAVVRRAEPSAYLIALMGAATLLVVLARQKQSLEVRYLELAARLHDPYVGMYVPGVHAPSVHGDSLLIGEPPDGQGQVLFVFNTTCPYSRASLPSWKAVTAGLVGESRVRVYGVSTDSLEATRAYALAHGFTFPVVTFTEAKTRVLYHLRQVPQTLILDEEGRVVFARLGVVESEAAADSIVVAAQAALHP